ncbi:MAG: AI-2E family transporter [Armatimonadota bacterium]|nr:AI-2E family transporter [Armatimonadota bacterium]MDR7453026.1 AI-2E family transporter [Armatimonadota bacterium]MDR7496360.1 AI-2E family transporter [Armatimonadota bacterium]MDR7510566.1 AI-2E family transporter [Armatimonadota bacterium]
MSPRTSLALVTAAAVLTILAVIGLAAVLVQIIDVVVLVLVAVILAAGLAVPVEALRRRRWGRRGWQLARGTAIVVVLVSVGAGALLAAAALVSPLVAQADELAAQAPEALASARLGWDWLRERYPWLPGRPHGPEGPPPAAERLGELLAAAAAAVGRALASVISGVLVLVFTAYLLLDGPRMKTAVLVVLPPATRARVSRVLGEVQARFGGWVRGQLVLCVVAGVLAGLGTWALGLPYPLLLGLFAGVTMLIPMIGPALGAVPPVLLALVGPWERLLATVVVFVAIFQVEMNVVVPRVMARAVGLSPLLTIVAVAAGAALLGMAGALLAVPVAAALHVVVDEVRAPAARG